MVLARCWQGVGEVWQMSNVSSGLMEYVAKAVERHKGGPGGKKQKVGKVRLDRVGASPT